MKSSPKKSKILIIGNGRHGKDTVAEILRDYHDFKFTSSSLFCSEFVETAMGQFGYMYDSPEECYEDRHNHRALWFDLISAYNTPDKARTAREMLEQGYDLYVGMRAREEFEAAKGLFDHIIWVDRGEHLPEEASDSMQLTKGDADFTIDNNGSMRDLWQSINDHIVLGFLDKGKHNG